MGLVLITPPVEPVVSLEEAKAHLRVDTAEEDALIEAYIKAATEHVEKATGRALITQTWQYTQDYFPPPGAFMRLPRVPVQSVTFLKYLDASGVLTTLAATEYLVDLTPYFAEILLGYQKTWPTIRGQRAAIVVEFVAGYGNEPSSVPAPLKAAVLLLLGDLYMSREANIIGTIIQENPTVERLIHSYRTTMVA